MSFIAKIALFMLAGDAVCWWEAHRRLGAVRHSGIWRWANSAFFAAQAGGLVLLICSREGALISNALLSKPLLSAVYLWHCLLLPPLLFAYAGLTCAVLAQREVKALAFRPKTPERALPAGDRPLSRRRFLAATTAAVPAAFCIGGVAAALPQLERFRTRRFTLPLAQLPAELDGLTIAHVSDLHVGRFTQGGVLERIVEATNALAADLVLMPGDLINYALHDLPAALSLVRRMRAAHGVFLCVGNHDVIENGDEFVRRTRAAGVKLLVNESALVEIRGRAVQLLGLRWGGPGTMAFGRYEHGDEAIAASMRELLAGRRDDAFPILLAHHPHAFDFAENIPLTLAGHTHGGQLMLNDRLGFGPALFRYWSGLYESAGRALVVSNGVGNWFPLRTRAPAEIVHLTLAVARHSNVETSGKKRAGAAFSTSECRATSLAAASRKARCDRNFPSVS